MMPSVSRVGAASVLIPFPISYYTTCASLQFARDKHQLKLIRTSTAVVGGWRRVGEANGPPPPYLV